MNFETERIIDSNGQLYRVGWDDAGWFSIQMVEENPNRPGEYVQMRDTYIVSFTPSGADELIKAIEEGL